VAPADAGRRRLGRGDVPLVNRRSSGTRPHSQFPLMAASRLLVVPAAGVGSRLGGAVPKLLVPVAGVPMIDRILDLYRDRVSHVVVVVNPASAADVRRHLEARRERLRVDLIEQPAPTGMLDAILLAVASVRSGRRAPAYNRAAGGAYG
jgi:hypothetical protein